MKRQTKNDIKEFLAQQKLNAIVFFLLVALVCFFVKYIKYNDVKDVISTLQSISAAIFTIVGLWVGFLYPNAIASIVTDDIDYIKNTKDAPRIEKLIYVIIISALVMLGTLFFYFLRSLIGNSSFYLNNVFWIKTIALIFIYYMVWLQSKCIFSVILSNINFANNLHTRINNSKIEHKK
ncbi:TPA: hypothetical protein PXN48_000656 [Yersinia enterocolitica]|nr:hypothetical protein [Yersinia enterocolitica]